MKKEEKENKEIAELKNQIEILTNNWKRALADYQNLERRYEKEKKDFLEYANSILILKLICSLDNFEKVQGYLKDNGLELAIKEFKKVLSEEGLTEIEVKEKLFNPYDMEAVDMVEGGESGKVAEVLSKGYNFKKRVLCPAKVKVYKGEERKEREEPGVQTEPSFGHSELQKGKQEEQ